MSEITTTPITVSYRDEGFLNAGISASATTITIAPIYKYPSGVKTKQGLNSTGGFAEISLGNITEIISFGASSIDGTTKVTTWTDVRRGLSQTGTTATFSAGTGRQWAKGARVRVIDFSTYIHNTAFTDKANTFSALQTLSAGATFSGTTATITLPTMNSTQRDNLTPANGMLIYNSTTGTLQQYSGGAWASVGTDATANGSTTVAGKFEEATVAEQGSATATGGTGARLVPAVANIVKTSAGAGDENKLVVLNAAGAIDVSAGGTGVVSPTSGRILVGAGTSAMTQVAPTANTFLGGNGTTWAATTGVPIAKLTSSADSNDISTGTSATDFDKNYTVTANDLAAGVTYILEAWGVVNGGTNTRRPIIGFNLGSVVLFTFTRWVAPNSAQPFYVRCTMTCRSTGGSGTVQAGGFLSAHIVAAADPLVETSSVQESKSALATVDTTASAVLKLTGTWNTDDGTGKSLILKNVVISRLAV